MRLLLLRVTFPVCLAIYLMLAWHNALAFEAPAFQGDVFDEAGILSESDRDTLRERVRTLRDSDDIWVAIYIARSLQQTSIEEAAVATFEKWKLGQKGKDNGVLVLLAPSDRKMRIEVGYGLEGMITDVLSRRIIDGIYTPAFREQRFAEGLLLGFEVMAKARRGENALPDLPPEPAQQDLNWDGAGDRFLLSLAINILPAAFYAAAQVYGRRHGRVRKTEGDADVRTPLFIFLFFGLFFGLFYAVFGAAFPDDPQVITGLMWGNALFAAVFGIPFVLKARGFISDSGYQRHQVSSAKSGGTSNQGSSRWESSDSSSSSSRETLNK